METINYICKKNMDIKNILLVIVLLFSTGGSLLILYSDRKRIKENPIAAFSKLESYLSKNADPTLAIRQKIIYAPHNKRMKIIFTIGIILFLSSMILGIILIFWK